MARIKASLVALLVLAAPFAARGAPQVVNPVSGAGQALFDLLAKLSPALSFDIEAICDVITVANGASNTKTCNALGKGEAGVVNTYSNVCANPNATGTGPDQAQPPTKNADGSPAPSPLNRRIIGVPSQFTGLRLTQVLSKDGGTMAFLWQCLLNLYITNSCCAQNGGSVNKLLIPAGWTAVGGEQGIPGLYYVQQPALLNATSRNLPYASAFAKGDSLVLAVRGTGSDNEWGSNYAYKLTDGPGFDLGGGGSGAIPGQVHSGFAAIFQSLWPRLLPAVSAAGIKRVYVTGHSQGANPAAMIAYAAARVLARNNVEGRTVDLVALGTPLGGDSDFVDGVADRVEVRNVDFEADVVSLLPCKGSAFTGAINFPACGAPPALVSTLTPPRDRTYISRYRPHKGLVRIVPDLLPAQQAQWAQVKDWTASTAEFKLIAAHVCSYTCFLATYSRGWASPDKCLLTGPAANGRTVCTV